MTTIRIVKNPDRCHCSIDNVPVATFMYSNYRDQDKDADFCMLRAIDDAKVQCYNELLRLDRDGIKAVINPYILII